MVFCHGGSHLELIDGKFGKHVDQVAEGAEIIDYSGYSIAPICDTIFMVLRCSLLHNTIEGTLHTVSKGLLVLVLQAYQQLDLFYERS